MWGRFGVGLEVWAGAGIWVGRGSMGLTYYMAKRGRSPIMGNRQRVGL